MRRAVPALYEENDLACP